MAYYLQFDGTNDYVSILCQATSAESWSLEWQLFSVPTPDGFGFARIFGGSTVSDSTERISSQIGGGDISTRFNNVNKIWSGLTFTNTDVFRIDYNGSQLELFINGVSAGVIAGTVVTDIRLLGANSNLHTNIALKYATFTNITTPSKSRDYQPSLSNGTGLALPDAVNASDGTLTNFPVDNSQWVFYSSGGATSSFLSESVSSSSFIYEPGLSSSFSSSSPSASNFIYIAELTSSFSSSNASSSSVTCTAEQGGANKNSSFSSESVSDSSFVYSPNLTAYVSSGTGSVSAFSYAASLSSSFISYNVSQSSFTQFIPTPEQPAVDLPISSYGNNKQWKQSIFFTQFL